MFGLTIPPLVVGIVTIIFGIIVLIFPRILNYLIGIWLIVYGLMIIF